MKPEIMRIDRHRLSSDGEGVTTLVCFHGCPLKCAYCINDYCHNDDVNKVYIPVEELLSILEKDDIYFRMTGGGITFGGGEALLYVDYIYDFAKIMPQEWKLRIETSLYVPWENIEKLIPFVDQWIVDVKDVNPDIFEKYTKMPQGNLLFKYMKLFDQVGKEKILFRIPSIPNYNTKQDVSLSKNLLCNYGEIDCFIYIVRKDRDDKSFKSRLKRFLEL